MRKNINIILIVLLVIIIIIGIVLKVIDIKIEAEEDAVAVTFKNYSDIEFLSENKVSDFIEQIQGELTDDHIVQPNRIGEYEVWFEYKSIRNKKKNKSFKINVIDTTKPCIYMDNVIEIDKGEEIDIEDYILSGDECDSNPTRKLEGNYDIYSAGDYNLKYIVTDASGNKEIKDFVLRVIDENNENSENNNDNNEKEDNTMYSDIKFSDIKYSYKKTNTKIGIDVSEWQDNIDWKKVKNEGVEFAFIRVGYQKGQNKENEEDSFFEKNIKGAINAKIPVGVYFFSYASTVDEANDQAEWVYNKIKNYNIELPVLFDWEDWSCFNDYKMSFYDINHIAETFIDKITEFGYKGSLYSSKYYLERIWNIKKFENVCLANYVKETEYKGNYQFWQICDTGIVDGISTKVDIDIEYE